MPLPKLNTITYQLVLPSNNQKITYRPFTVEEEKILLTAQESDESKDILHAMRQIINNCVQEQIDVEQMPTFDLEYFFLNIRSKSTGDVIELILKHPNSTNAKGEHCEGKQTVAIQIDDIKVEKSENHKNKFQLDDKIGIQLKYPTFELLTESQEGNNDEFEDLINLIANSIDIIYDENEVYNASDSPKEELISFVKSMNQNQMKMVQEFFETMPVLRHTITYTCPACECEETIEIKGFQNFFL